ncbi:Beta-glucuronidase-like protein [Cladobotryum mycophilum]|uniref:Beta-glucuronidase-like protein n=1 Tax=Cladobotryum mycophilum TaxID=491253 RepID=A0ABR0SHS7_9HYPO
MKLLTTLIFLAQALAAPLPLSIPTTKPKNAFLVPPDFVGFGIESAFLNDFANTFSENLVSSLAARLSKPPILRIGGTGGDHLLFDPHQKEDKVCVKGPCGDPAATYLLGPSFFDGYKRFGDARMTIQAPLDKPLNVTNTLAYVWRAWNSLGRERVAVIALGNEVEYIYQSGVKSYVDAALSLQEAVVKNLSLSGAEARIFEAGNTASGTVVNRDSYKVQDILGAGINNNGKIASTAEHWYQIGAGNQDWTDGAMQSLMINHTAITERFKLYTPALTASRNQGIPFAIGENAAVLGGGPITFSGGFGYGLWALDFNLAAMARGVSRVNNLCARPRAPRLFWNPSSAGGKQSPGPQEVETKRDLLSAYAMYDDRSNKLQRVALINLRLYNGTRGGTRGQEMFQVSVGDIKSAKVRRLRAEKGVAAMGYDFGGPGSNVTWAGEQWSHAIDMGKGHFVHGGVEESVVEVKGGLRR